MEAQNAIVVTRCPSDTVASFPLLDDQKDVRVGLLQQRFVDTFAPYVFDALRNAAQKSTGGPISVRIKVDENGNKLDKGTCLAFVEWFNELQEAALQSQQPAKPPAQRWVAEEVRINNLE